MQKGRVRNDALTPFPCSSTYPSPSSLSIMTLRFPDAYARMRELGSDPGGRGERGEESVIVWSLFQQFLCRNSAEEGIFCAGIVHGCASRCLSVQA